MTTKEMRAALSALCVTPTGRVLANAPDVLAEVLAGAICSQTRAQPDYERWARYGAGRVMDIIALDAETFFSADYTLSKMTTEAYVRDPRFECFGFGVRWAHGGYSWIDGANKDWLRGAVDWSNTAVLAHHAHFDGLILAHHFGIKPAFWFDTLSMARLVLGNHVRVGLDKLAHHFKLAPKTVPYDLMRGRHWSDLDAAAQRLVIDGCIHDLELTWAIFEKLMGGFPREELAIIDSTVRMFTEPKLVGDTVLFDKIRDDEALRKNEKLYALDVGEKDLMSADKFGKLLEAEGVDIVYKEGKAGPIPAFAKTDQFMKDLLEHDNERVADLALARTEVRSTLDETRAGRLAAMSRRGPLCVYLSYCAAHTRRWGGGDSINAQNLRRRSDLRRGLRAPDGYLFASVDQSQGECRLVNWFAGQEDVLQRFRDGVDPYIGIASEFYRQPIRKPEKGDPDFVEMETKRGTGKQLELSCGFGAGDETIVRTAARGTYGPPVYLTLEEGARAKHLYRDTHPKVEVLWKTAGHVISKLKAGVAFEWGPGDLLHGEKGRLYHPNGVWLDYTQLQWRSDEREWRLRTRDGWVKMYGAKLVENVIQWLSRIVTSQALLRVKEAGYPIVGMAHDDLWVLIPDDKQPDRHGRFLVACMAVEPAWAPGLPLGAECKIGASYG
jgi:DNA polymerase